MISWTEVCYRPTYLALGKMTPMVLVNDTMIEILAQDKSSGVEMSEGGLDVGILTVVPAALVLMHDVLTLGLTAPDLIDAVIDLNGVSWQVRNYHNKPSPGGENDGELYLMLMEPDC